MAAFVQSLAGALVCWGAALSMLRCGEDESNVHYFRIKSCHKFNSSVIARATLPTFTECTTFAAEKQALALNFSPYKKKRGLRRRGGDPNCEALGCPDLDNLAGLVNDRNFDYYAQYGNTEGVGVFALYTEGENYTRATNVCGETGGRLARAATETRTAGLAELLATRLSTWTKVAYVTLAGDAGEPLECHAYRAWAPGHPRARPHRRCPLLDDAALWRTVDCDRAIPYVCELRPQPPYLNEYRTYANISCTTFRNQTQRTFCKSIKKKFQAALLSAKKYKERRRKSECD